MLLPKTKRTSHVCTSCFFFWFFNCNFLRSLIWLKANACVFTGIIWHPCFLYMTMKHCQVKRFKYTWKKSTTLRICMYFLCKSFQVLNAACKGFQCGQSSSQNVGCFAIVLNPFLFLRYLKPVRCLSSKDTGGEKNSKQM